MLYPITSFKHILLMISDNTDPLYSYTIKSFFSFSNLFDTKIISSLYVKNAVNYIDEKQSENLLNALFIAHNIKFDLSYFNRVAVDTNFSDCTIINFESMEEFKNKNSFIQIKKDKVKQIKKEINNKFETPIPYNIENLKLVSIDFEYANKKNSISEFYEMGITVQKNGICTSYHYIIGTPKTNKPPFNFGESNFIDCSEVNSIFNQHIQDADYVVGHNLKVEYLLLKELKFPWKRNNVKFLCTSNIIKKYFKIFKDQQSKEPINDHIRLSNALSYLNIAYSDLHNSGNDSFYTLQLLNELSNIRTKSLLMHPNQRRRIQIKKVNKL